MKNFLFWLLFLIIAVPAFARDFSYTYKGQCLTYTVISESAKTCKTKDGSNAISSENDVIGSLEIPSTVSDGINNYSVTSIGDYAFLYSKNLTSITIPNSITSIGEKAFHGCWGLTSITIPNSVTSIGRRAFTFCRNLVSINVDEENTQYSSVSGILFNKTKKTILLFPPKASSEYSIPNSVTSIGDYAFYYCQGLKSVTIPNSVTSIGDYAFHNCYNLTSLTNSNSVTLIGESAFYGCSGLTSITIPNSVTSIGKDTFSGSGLESVTIPNSVTAIGNSAFSNCIRLTSITIPNSVTSIGDNAFYSCKALTYVSIPNSVTSIGNCALALCPNLVSINVDEGNTQYSSVNGILFNKTKKTILSFPSKASSEYSIPNSVTSIGNSAFYGCSGLTSVTIPNSVTAIGDSAFYGCSGLTSVTIPNSVTSIGNSAFVLCRGLTSLTIPTSVTSIGNHAFSYCSGLTSVSIPNSATSIGEGTFSYCSGLASVTIPNSVTSIGKDAFYRCRGLTSVTIPNSVTAIGEGTFSYCSGLASVTIPNSVTSIGNSAFLRCTGLTSVTIPNSVTSIGENAFGSCSGLTSVTIPSSVTSIGSYAFDSCSGLTSVAIPNSVTSIGSYAFYGCSGLTSIISMATDAPKIDFNTFKGLYSTVTLLIPKKSIKTYAISNWGQFDSLKYIDAEGETTTYSDGVLNYFIILADNNRDKNIAIVKSGNYSNLLSVVIPEIVTDNKSNNYYITGIGSAAFNGCNCLNGIHFNKSSAITIIGSYAFSNTDITSIEFPSTLTKIEDGAFNYCTSLRSISIPNSVTFIGGSAFKDCRSLTSVTLGNSIKSISDRTFSGCNLKTIVLPPSVETIGCLAFAGNSYLDKIIMGRNVKSIDDNAFYTANPGTVYITAPVPPTVATEVFGLTGRLYVQGGTNLDAYYDAARCWQKFEGYVMSEPQSLTMEEPATKPLGKAGETFTLKATLTPADVDLPYIFWRSTDPEKAYVDNDGKVTVLQNITAEDNVEIIAETLYYNGPIAKFSFATNASGIDDIAGDTTSTMDVFTLQGVQVLRNATREQFDNLASGIYIIRSGKSVRKVVK